jgi:hypothetical protein
MHISFRSLTGAFPVGAAFLWAVSANAAPPDSCAKKFIGVWIHQGIGGITNKATFTADGTAACSENEACLQGTWTCNGNVLTYNSGMYITDYTLQPDGTMTARGGIVVTRDGGAPIPDKAPSRSSGQPVSVLALPRAKASDGCLQPPAPHDWEGLITAICKSGVHLWTTSVRPSRQKGCPRDVDFTYLDPETQTTKSSNTTLSPIYTCGAPATNIRVR